MVSQKSRGDVIRLTIIWVVLSALGEAAIAYYVGDYPGTASKQGIVTSEAVIFLLWVTVPVFTLVALIIVYAMIRFRVADDDETPSESQYRSGRAFPWGWVAVSTVLNLLFIVHPGLTGLTALWSMAQAATNPVDVDVTAAQWQWRFNYPDQKLSNVSELVVPVDTPVHFELHSKDVIHSFWVPAWGIKKAVIPGETRTLVVTPDRIVDTVTNPTARLQCAQICGVGHGQMRAAVRVVSRADFNQWVKLTRAAMQKGGMSMPGMQEQGDGMPGMDMPAGQPKNEGMPGMNMPPQAPGESQMPMGDSTSAMPDMDMPAQGGTSEDMPGMNMPGRASSGERMPMEDDRQDGSQN
jgi:cytochrome c oxidase subunit 2